MIWDLKNKIAALPSSPGVYIYKDKDRNIIYIGKATSLKDRVRSYFNGFDVRGERIFSMVAQIADIEIRKTDSVLEALILESNLIKKFQPKYNVKEKDDKSFSYFVITKEEFPRVLIMRRTELDGARSFSRLWKEKKEVSFSRIFGPYTSKKQMETALKIMRKIFPFHSSRQKTEKGCLDFQLGRCPGPFAGAITKTDYKKNIKGIRMILEGRKSHLLKSLEKEMKEYANKNEFEKAGEARNKIFALKHIQDVALVTRDEKSQFQNPKSKITSKSQIKNFKPSRIEAYDISNISGDHAVGSMAVFDNSNGKFEPNKSQYRKFKIKTVGGANDVGSMAEVLFRRFKNDWQLPNLILLDGGQGHLNMGEKVLGEFNLEIPIGAVAKGPTRKNLEFRISNFESNSNLKNILKDKNLIKRIMDEAHRFAVGYHRKLRKKNLLKIDG